MTAKKPVEMFVVINQYDDAEPLFMGTRSEVQNFLEDDIEYGGSDTDRIEDYTIYRVELTSKTKPTIERTITF